MNHLQLEREQDLFHSCLALPDAERNEFLANVCSHDADMQRRIKNLLQAHEYAEKSHLYPLPLPTAACDLESVGPYRLIRVLGEGGMGIVYEAEQWEPIHRRVALKIVKIGMDTREVVARFMTERQALAAMDHSHIAKVFDAGQTATGRPYFVMELVSGVPLLEYCDTYQLSIAQRVELLILICQAVQHAHQKGVVHRDLKPSNILVSGSASNAAPKIIDFGIAKAVHLDMVERMTRYTGVDQVLGTPAYMSPEQAGFGRTDIDTRTDVYSLGVILYELLAGCLPADPADLGHVRFLSMLTRGEITTTRPSLRIGNSSVGLEAAAARSTTVGSLKGQLEGDLDWIVVKSLEIDRNRRYETTEALAEDLRRYRLGVPVSAHPPTISYRLQKFVQRHRMQVVAAGMVGLSLMTSMIAASIGFVRATRAELVAKQEATTSRQISDFLVQLFTLSSKHEAPGKPTTVQELLERGASTIEKDLKGQPVVQANLFGTLSRVYEAIGQYRESKRFAEKSLALPHAPGMEGELQVATLLLQLGSTQQRLGNMEETCRLYKEALSIRLRILGENHLDTARALNNLGLVYGLLEQHDEATSFHKRALAIQQKIGGRFHRDVANSLRGLALIEDRKGNVEAGLRLFRSAQEIVEKNYGPDHSSAAAGLQDIAVSLKKLKRLEEARQLLERSLAILQRVEGPNHPRVSFTEHSLALVLIDEGKPRAALPLLEDAYRIRMETMGPDNPRTADIANSLGTLWVNLGNTEKGRLFLEQALRGHERAYGPNHSSTLETRAYLARTLVRAGRYDEALSHLRALTLSAALPAMNINLQDPVFHAMRKTPGFQQLLAEANRSELPKKLTESVGAGNLGNRKQGR